MFRAVFFDLDELLIDARESHHEADVKVFKKYDMNFKKALRLTRDRDFLGTRLIDTLKVLRDVLGVSEKELPLKELAKSREEFFVHSVKQKALLLPGADYAVKRTKKLGKIVGVISSGTKWYVETALSKFNLTPYVDFRICEEDVEKGKPHPECYEKAYLRAQKFVKARKQECLVVEDSTNGVKAAHAAGLPTCLVPLYQPHRIWRDPSVVTLFVLL
ncbi:HAD family phosphatase [Candidatus Roizmanbacteria bacterium]|nr:HAD family phosphatase [Candidatus Roizmanbacteria bacterium]